MAGVLWVRSDTLLYISMKPGPKETLKGAFVEFCTPLFLITLSMVALTTYNLVEGVSVSSSLRTKGMLFLQSCVKVAIPH